MAKWYISSIVGNRSHRFHSGMSARLPWGEPSQYQRRHGLCWTRAKGFLCRRFWGAYVIQLCQWSVVRDRDCVIWSWLCQWKASRVRLIFTNVYRCYCISSVRLHMQRRFMVFSNFRVYTRVDRYLDWIENEIGDRSGQRNENRRRPNGNRRRPNGNHRRPNNRKRNKNRRNQNRNPQVVNNQDYNDNDGVIFGK